jgi:hypothetical protein
MKAWVRQELRTLFLRRKTATGEGKEEGEVEASTPSLNPEQLKKQAQKRLACLAHENETLSSPAEMVETLLDLIGVLDRMKLEINIGAWVWEGGYGLRSECWRM